MTRYRFRIGLPGHKLERYYRGEVRNVIVTTDQGITLQMPINILRRFVSRDGIYGEFIIDVDDNSRMQQIRRIDS